MDVYERFIEHLCGRQVGRVPENAVVELFRDFKFPLSADALRLCTMIGGIEDFQSDNYEFCIWSLDRMQDENRSAYRCPYTPVGPGISRAHRQGGRCLISCDYVNSPLCPGYPQRTPSARQTPKQSTAKYQKMNKELLP